MSRFKQEMNASEIQRALRWYHEKRFGRRVVSVSVVASMESVGHGMAEHQEPVATAEVVFEEDDPPEAHAP